jgi:hypothetical protein
MVGHHREIGEARRDQRRPGQINPEDAGQVAGIKISRVRFHFFGTWIDQARRRQQGRACGASSGVIFPLEGRTALLTLSPKTPKV